MGAVPSTGKGNIQEMTRRAWAFSLTTKVIITHLQILSCLEVQGFMLGFLLSLSCLKKQMTLYCLYFVMKSCNVVVLKDTPQTLGQQNFVTLKGIF